ncbi:MAG: hypothetical protein R3B47_17915 [Bacteroidia bacterium]
MLYNHYLTKNDRDKAQDIAQRVQALSACCEYALIDFFSSSNKKQNLRKLMLPGFVFQEIRSAP